MLNEKKINGVLQRASGNGHTETVRALLDAGADVHAREDLALRWASRNGHTEIVRALREAMDASSLQKEFKARAGIDVTVQQAATALRIVRELDGTKAPAP